MALSTNVKQETMAAMRSSTSQTEAAGKLGITQSALCYRIKNDPDLMELAVSKGFVRGKNQERPAVTEAAKILGAAPTQGEDRGKAAETKGVPPIEHDPVFEKSGPVLAFKGAVVLFGESYWVDVRVERRAG